MPRINIYVSDAMKERMDALRDRVKWSEVAQAAFDREISISTVPKDPNMDQVIERLRASKIEHEKAVAKKGRQDGREHAKRWLKYADLQAIANLELEGEHFASQVDRALGNSGTQWGDSFWNDGEMNTAPSDDYVEAFVEGCKDIWNEIADKV